MTAAVLSLPPLDDRITWSIRIADGNGAVLAEQCPDTVCRTASVGKIFLLIEVARRLAAGELDPDERIEAPEELRVADSGLLYRMRDQRIRIADAALLVGAMSDNLATNALLARCGLEAVRAVAPGLGYEHTALLDYIRDERLPDMPWTPSYGCGAELCDVIGRLAAGTVVSPDVSAQVLSWLAADTDTSMVAQAMLTDPLAHLDPDFEGIVLRHKTGTTSFARIDVGWVQGPRAGVAYAVCANWAEDVDLRASALRTMNRIGEEIREYITGISEQDALRGE
ncbi:MAG: class A beta-lactamase-related serine hydrolase [Microbacteriaceae bacterium]|jgi:beta-lactamase class A|nr:class A beta-lactamase-related serine hydrolase [Microbacteriaceae bacterium]MCI1207429.1 class A beta-lactamase-related serine hydrolase [Microbacteriaceae bacterium]